MPSRRELLVGFLGLAAANACRRAKVEPEPLAGALVDRVHEVGHLLRGAPLPVASEDSGRFDVLVVGGGAAGLSAGWRLRGAGAGDFLVLEVDEAMGGTARSGRNAVSAFPWGAHYLPAPLDMHGPVPRLLRELGVVASVGDDGTPRFDEAVLIHEPDERLFYRGLWYEGQYLWAGSSEDDRAQLARFDAMMRDLSRARDGRGRKAFAVPLETGSDDAEWTQLDKLSMAEWMESHGFTSPRLRWLVDYACRDDYGAEAATTSAWAGLWYFCARQTGDERNEGFLSWPEGNGRLMHHLSAAIGKERLKTDVLVHTVEPAEGGGWRVHAVEAKTRAPVRYHARQVVLATPRFVAGHLVAPWRRERPAFLDAFRYSPWVVANLTLSERPWSRGFPQAWDNVLYESRSLGYVVATHQSLRASDIGPSVWTWYYPLSGADEVAERRRLLDTSFDDWQRLVVADLWPAHVGLAKAAQRLDVMRWGHAMIRPVPGFVWGGARQHAQASLEGGLHFAHSDLGGLALFEEANWHGVRAAEAALTGLGRDVESWL